MRFGAWTKRWGTSLNLILTVKIFWYFMHMRGKTICEFTVIIWDAAFTTWPEGGPFFSCARRRASDAHSPGMAQYL